MREILDGEMLGVLLTVVFLVTVFIAFKLKRYIEENKDMRAELQVTQIKLAAARDCVREQQKIIADLTTPLFTDTDKPNVRQRASVMVECRFRAK